MDQQVAENLVKSVKSLIKRQKALETKVDTLENKLVDVENSHKSEVENLEADKVKLSDLIKTIDKKLIKLEHDMAEAVKVQETKAKAKDKLSKATTEYIDISTCRREFPKNTIRFSINGPNPLS